jgi:hypothetical protein
MEQQMQEALHQIQQATEIVMVLPPEASADVFGSGLALAQALRHHGKQVQLTAPYRPERLLQQADAKFPVDEFVDPGVVSIELGNKDLQVSFPYDPGTVDKVNYHIDEDEGIFSLTVQPQSGTPPLDASQVSFHYVGARADLIILHGVHDLETLEHIYNGYEDFFSSTTKLSIHRFEPDTADFKIVTERSFAETVHRVLQQLEIEMNSSIASNLLRGIEGASEHFQSLAVKPETFEVVADLLRAGATRSRPHSRPQVTENSTETNRSTTPAGAAAGVSNNGFAAALGKEKHQE